MNSVAVMLKTVRIIWTRISMPLCQVNVRAKWKNFSPSRVNLVQYPVFNFFGLTSSLVYNKEHSPDRLASPQANSIYTLTQSDASDDFIPPKPSGKIFFIF